MLVDVDQFKNRISNHFNRIRRHAQRYQKGTPNRLRWEGHARRVFIHITVLAFQMAAITQPRAKT